MAHVVDSSVLIAAVTEEGDVPTSVRTALETTDLIAPHLIDIEIAHGLRRMDQIGVIDAGKAFRRFRLVAINRFDHEPLLPRVWELRHDLTAYDAAYVALAEAADTPLLTLDRRIASAPGHHAEVIVL